MITLLSKEGDDVHETAAEINIYGTTTRKMFVKYAFQLATGFHCAVTPALVFGHHRASAVCLGEMCFPF
jgi:hypothetical protein